MKERKQFGRSISAFQNTQFQLADMKTQIEATRLLVYKAEVLLLDEPSMGLYPLLVGEMFEKIIDINKRGITILLNEQYARLQAYTPVLT